MRRFAPMILAVALHALVLLLPGRPVAKLSLRKHEAIEVTLAPQGRPDVQAVGGPVAQAPVASLSPGRLRERSRSADTMAPAGNTTPESSSPERSSPERPSSPEAPPQGTIDLFPRSAISGAAGEVPRGDGGRGRTRRGEGGGEREGGGALGGEGEGEAARVGERVQGFLDDAVATARTRGGAVAPEWRAAERELVKSFHPPPGLLVDAKERTAGGRIVRLGKQFFAAWKRGEEGLRKPIEHGLNRPHLSSEGGIDASNQGLLGVPEGLNLRAMPGEQAAAAQGAIGRPAGFIAVEIEATTGADGTVRVRVAETSGRRAYDRHALEAVERAVANGRVPPCSKSRWRLEAGYAVEPLNAIGLSFDANFKLSSFTHPLKERVEEKVDLLWARRLAAAPHDMDLSAAACYRR